ncbi:MAG: hypothetical protein U0031_07325 [Thermomicrobiales bacterium]
MSAAPAVGIPATDRGGSDLPGIDEAYISKGRATEDEASEKSGK